MRSPSLHKAIVTLMNSRHARAGMAVLAGMLLATFAVAEEIPPGTALPVTLNQKLSAARLRAGKAISASIAQDVPLPSGARIHSGSRVTGQVLEMGSHPDGTSYVRFRFEKVRVRGKDIPITTTVRALASPREVEYAHLPKHTPIRGETPANWITTQVGGDVVYRGGGQVMHGEEVVGDPVTDGVLVRLEPLSQPGCEHGSGDRKLALWVFSSSACGIYGFDDLAIAHHGATPPLGEIVFETAQGLDLPTGAAMLLIVAGPAQP